MALEDIDPDSGPLFYLPGSHRWPFYHSDDVIREKPELEEIWTHARAAGDPDKITERMGVAWTESFLKMEREKAVDRIKPPLRYRDYSRTARVRGGQYQLSSVPIEWSIAGRWTSSGL